VTRELPIGDDDLHAYVDERLTLERKSAVEAFLGANPAPRERVEAYRRDREALRARLRFKEREPIPARLRVSAIMTGQGQRTNVRMIQAAAVAASLLVGSAAGWFAHGYSDLTRSAAAVAEASRPAMTSEAIAAHRTFVVEVAHPVEVRAFEQAHLMQWLSKRLGEPLSAPDLTTLGFRLMGGRLLPAGNAAAAQLMYDDDRGTRLTLYVRAGESGETAFRFAQHGEFSVLSWLDRGLGYAVSAALERDRLSAVAKAVYDQLEAAPQKKRTSPL
jgi:anti-sigma factor RsiW